MTNVKYDDLELAFDYVNCGGPSGPRAYVSLDSGKTFLVSDWDEAAGEEIPEDLETSDRYVEVPHKNDLDLGRVLVLRFAEERLPHQRDRISDFFHRRGAYARFKDLLTAENRLDEWYKFEADVTRQTLGEWCTANGMTLTDGGGIPDE